VQSYRSQDIKTELHQLLTYDLEDKNYRNIILNFNDKNSFKMLYNKCHDLKNNPSFFTIQGDDNPFFLAVDKNQGLWLISKNKRYLLENNKTATNQWGSYNLHEKHLVGQYLWKFEFSDTLLKTVIKYPFIPVLTIYQRLRKKLENQAFNNYFEKFDWTEYFIIRLEHYFQNNLNSEILKVINKDLKTKIKENRSMVDKKSDFHFDNSIITSQISSKEVIHNQFLLSTVVNNKLDTDLNGKLKSGDLIILMEFLKSYPSTPIHYREIVSKFNVSRNKRAEKKNIYRRLNLLKELNLIENIIDIETDMRHRSAVLTDKGFNLLKSIYLNLSGYFK
jgi:hypothetical protein